MPFTSLTTYSHHHTVPPSQYIVLSIIQLQLRLHQVVHNTHIFVPLSIPTATHTIWLANSPLSLSSFLKPFQSATYAKSSIKNSQMAISWHIPCFMATTLYEDFSINKYGVPLLPSRKWPHLKFYHLQSGRRTLWKLDVRWAFTCIFGFFWK